MKSIENQASSFYAIATEKVYLRSPGNKVFMVTVGDDGALTSSDVTDKVISGEINAHTDTVNGGIV